MRVEVGRVMREFPFPPAAKNNIVVKYDIQKFMRCKVSATPPRDADKYDFSSLSYRLGTIQNSLLMSRAVDYHCYVSLSLAIFGHRE